MKILVVDDYSPSRKILRLTLAAEGHEVEEAADGEEALEKLKASEFDALISDILMPRMDGYRLCYKARLMPELQKLAIIIYSSTYTSPAEEDIAESMGADRFLRKPAPTAAILAALSEAVRHPRAVNPSRDSPLGEIEVLQRYSERLVQKLEEKNLELSLSHDRLEIEERKFRELVSLAPIGIFQTAPDGRLLAANEAFVRMLGYGAPEELIGTDVTRTLYVDPAVRKEVLRRFETEKEAGFFEVNLRRKDGSVIWAETDGRAVRDGSGHVLRYEGFASDVTERRLAEKAIRVSEARFRRLFESNTIGITIANLDGKTLEANDAYLGMLGYSRDELLSGNVRWDDLTPAEYRPLDRLAIEELQKTGVATPWEKEMVRKDGARIPVLLGVAMLEVSEASCIAYMVDLSKSRELEEQLRQAQKMEAIGQLAGGVAHDFNNLLTSILGYTDLIASELRGDSRELLEELDEIRKAGQRAAGLTRQLLAFSRTQVLEPKVLNLNDVILNLERMLRRLIGEDIDLATALDPKLANVLADAGQIEQVIMNLAVNSRDAMPQGGNLTIETAMVVLDGEYASRHASVHPGRRVMLAVSDTGIGMDAATTSRIFEPFFTTKSKDKGTGLGLSTVYGIVKQSGGHIWVYSEPGKGTTFKIYFPPVEEPVDRAEVVAPSGPVAGTETVLLVEDEASVRALSRAILEGNGYTVLEASDGNGALAVAGRHEGRIDLLVTDVVMPHMGGSTLVARIRELLPKVRVLYMSGYTDDTVVRHGLIEGGGDAFLQKPFTPMGLLRKVRGVLDGGA